MLCSANKPGTGIIDKSAEESFHHRSVFALVRKSHSGSFGNRWPVSPIDDSEYPEREFECPSEMSDFTDGDLRGGLSGYRLGPTTAQMGKVHGSLAQAGKVRGVTPKVPKTDKPTPPRGRARVRKLYNKRFLSLNPEAKRKLGPNSHSQ
jgi:small subunit ribosomal protein S30e